MLGDGITGPGIPLPIGLGLKLPPVPGAGRLFWAYMDIADNTATNNTTNTRSKPLAPFLFYIHPLS